MDAETQWVKSITNFKKKENFKRSLKVVKIKVW